MKKRIRIDIRTIKTYSFVLLASISLNIWSQVGVGTTNPDASAALEIQSTTKGLLLPRMTGLQMNSIPSPAEGLLVYCTNCDPKGLYYYNGTAFVSSTSATESGSNGVTEIFSTTGKIWMDRNLGASQTATSVTDHLAYGSLFQWGRGADGHEVINWTSSTTSDGAEQTRETITTSPTDTPGHDDFIINSTDWRSTVNNNLWQGVSGVNNPCPSGFRVPTSTEWNAERAALPSANASGAYTALKLTIPGIRLSGGGILGDTGVLGAYWSSTGSTLPMFFDRASYFSITASSAFITTAAKASGYSVRCIKE